MFETKVLVTGATGFIAGHCIQELLAHGYAVRGSVRNLATSDVDYLRALAPRGTGVVEFVEARLDADAGWPEAVDGCTYVWHVASPIPSQAPDDEQEVIRPAVDGTLRVLRAAAASGSVRRVVMTSSIDAIRFGHESANGRPLTEADWSNVEHAEAYARSKTYAEQAAWEFVRGADGSHRLELVAINPGLVLGPLLHQELAPSLETIRLLMANALPAVPHLGFAVVDVRDLAVAHRLAMELPHATGNRYICAGEPMWMEEIAAVLEMELRPRGYAIPTALMPSSMVRTVAQSDKSMQRVLGMLDLPALVSPDKARRELGWSTRAARESIVDAAESLLQFGLVPRSDTDLHAESAGGQAALSRV